jgi:hypothetical protein
MEKQIEEIKDCIDSVYGCDCAYFGVDGLAIADALYTADYRKQSDTAREIIGEILLSHTPDIDGFFTMHECELVNLKNKYLKGE